MSLIRQPEQVEPLAAERGENLVGRRQFKSGPEFDQIGIDRWLMKVGFAVTPALLPKLVVVCFRVPFVVMDQRDRFMADP